MYAPDGSGSTLFISFQPTTFSYTLTTSSVFSILFPHKIILDIIFSRSDYAPYDSDHCNKEIFQKGCDALELNEPFWPVKKIISMLLDESSHADPKAVHWLMGYCEIPIIYFYMKDVPCDPK